MSSVKVLLLPAVAVPGAFTQDTSESQTECKFLDDKAISIALPDDSGRVARMTTNERPVTVKRISIPSGYISGDSGTQVFRNRRLDKA